MQRRGVPRGRRRFPIGAQDIILPHACWLTVFLFTARCVADISPGAQLTLLGNATQTGASVQLIPAAQFQRGAAWYPTPQTLQFGFDTTFQFRLAAQSTTGRGADGFAFVIQNDSRGTATVGGYGEFMGYGDDPNDTNPNFRVNGISKSLVVEFDTFLNGAQHDPSNNHVGIQFPPNPLSPNTPDHTLPGYSRGTAAPAFDMTDQNTHTARILYSAGAITIFLDGTQILQANNIDLTPILSGGQALVGFTSASGNTYQTHTISNWSLTSTPQCPAAISPTSITYSAGGGSGTLSVTAPASCAWTASSNAGFITVPANSGGAGNGTVSYTVASNGASAQRSGGINVVGTSNTFTLNITQSGLICTFTISLGSQSFPAGGGAGSVNVATPAGCPWNATSNVPWAGTSASGTGNGSAAFTVSANSTASTRTGTITIAGQIFTVSQASAQQFTCSVSPVIPANLRAEGFTELVADLVLLCSGTAATAITADVQVYFNVNVTSRLLDTLDTTEALLMINDNTANMFRGILAGYNTVRWLSVPIAPAPGNYTQQKIRLTNLRVNANQLGLAASQAPKQITALVAVQARTPVPVTNPQQIGGLSSTSASFQRGSFSPGPGANLTNLPLTYQELAPAAFKLRTVPNQDPSVPGVIHNAESGFVNTSLLGTQTGFSDTATRVSARFFGVPTGVRVFAPVFPATASAAQLVSANADGSGGTFLSGTSQFGGVFQELTVTAGNATATWELKSVNPIALESLLFNCILDNSVNGNLGNLQVTGTLAPTSAVAVASISAPVPRFVDVLPPPQVDLRVTDASTSGSSISRPLPAGLVTSRYAPVGGSVTSVFDVTNDSGQQSNNTILRDNVPAGTTFASCAATANGICGGSGNNRTVYWPSLAPGQKATATIGVTISDPSLTPGTVLHHDVTVSSDNVDVDLTSNQAFSAFSVTPSGPSNIPPTPVSITPASGNGAAQTFTVVFTDGDGYPDIATAGVVFNSVLDATSGCTVLFDRASNTASLNNDATGPMPLGSAQTRQNNLCILSGSGTSYVGAGTSLTLTVTLTFKPAFAGSKNIYLTVQDSTNNNSGLSQFGQWTVPGATAVAPTAVSASPNSGSGASQTFNFTFSDANGNSDIVLAEALINSTLDAAFGCVIVFDRVANIATLLTDIAVGGTPRSLGAAGAIENGQCAVDVGGATFSGSGNTLTVSGVAISFKNPFAGPKNIYLYAQDASGLSSGLPSRGTWTVPAAPNVPPQVISVSPTSGNASSQTFTFTWRDANGYADLIVPEVIINSVLDARNACAFYFGRRSNALFLLNDAANGSTPARLGTLDTFSNSQCLLIGSGASISASGTDLSLTITLAFRPGFAGAKNVYLYAVDTAGLTSALQQLGTFTVPAFTNAAPSNVSVSPASGSGQSAVITATFSDPNGFTDLFLPEVLINQFADGRNACTILYDRFSNTFFLVNDSSTGSFRVVAGSGGVAENGQCTLNGTGSSAVPSGTNSLILTLNLAFKQSFAGAKSVFLFSRDATGANSALTALGSWTVPGAANQPPVVVSVTPASAGGSGQVFQARFRDPNGYGDIVGAVFLINAIADSRNACHITFDKLTGTARLLDDAGLTSTAVQLDSAQTATNSQCTLFGTFSLAIGAGNDLVLQLNLQFKPAFAGLKNVYLYATDQANQNTGLQALGTFLSQ